MKSSWSAALFFLTMAISALHAQYKPALPGYHYSFPRDNFDHPDFQTEWWYYTGNLRDASGHRFGFELTFFRQGVKRPIRSQEPWEVHDLYLAHLALSDLDGNKFYHTERVNRSGPGIAGVNQAAATVWNGNWQIQWLNERQQKLAAVTSEFTLQLRMQTQKPPVIHGINGVSQKSQGKGEASHYISYTRLLTQGELTWQGKQYQLDGATWMDHEFFTNSLGSEQIGWDWLSLQLQDNTELMLYRFRRKDGSSDPFSSGTFIDAQGHTQHLAAKDFQLTPLRATWTSQKTHATYPIEWEIKVPSQNLMLHLSTPLASQELDSRNEATPSYWEGSVTVEGSKLGAKIQGTGYLEMTGYSKAVVIGLK